MVKPISSRTENLFQIAKENEDSKGFPHLSKYDGGISRNMTKKPSGAGFKRSCGKNCRIKWNNSNNNNNNNQIDNNFSPEEEDLIIKLHSTIGSRWSIIAQQLPGRTDNEVKNFWNKKLKKKLTAVGIDPITHRPFSQILADYSNINNGGGGFTSHKSRNHFFGGLKKTEHHHHHQYSMIQRSNLFSDFNNPFDSGVSCLQESSSSSSKDHFFTRIDSDPNNNGDSLDLLSQLQAISMVTDYESSRKNSCFQETFPLEPVSDQSNKSIASSSSFSWCDFLLEDEFLPVNDDDDDDEEEEQEDGAEISINEVKMKEQRPQQQSPAAAKEEVYAVVSGGGGGGSFLEAILETETDEMLSDFHDFLDEPF